MTNLVGPVWQHRVSESLTGISLPNLVNADYRRVLRLRVLGPGESAFPLNRIAHSVQRGDFDAWMGGHLWGFRHSSGR